VTAGEIGRKRVTAIVIHRTYTRISPIAAHPSQEAETNFRLVLKIR